MDKADKMVQGPPPAGVDEKDVATLVDVAKGLANGAADEPVLVSLLERLAACLIKYEATALRYLLNTFELHQGLQRLEALEAHSSRAVYGRTGRLLKTFFGPECDE